MLDNRKLFTEVAETVGQNVLKMGGFSVLDGDLPITDPENMEMILKMGKLVPEVAEKVADGKGVLEAAGETLWKNTQLGKIEKSAEKVRQSMVDLYEDKQEEQRKAQGVTP